MKPLGLYDGTLQMFVQEPRDADLPHLRFLRWLAEHGALQDDIAGPPAGSWCSSDGYAELDVTV